MLPDGASNVPLGTSRLQPPMIQRTSRRSWSFAIRGWLGLAALAGLSLAGLSLAGCEGQVALHGNPVDADELARLQPGVSKAEVVGLLGSPSSTPPFDDNTWYYMSDQEKTLAFFAPETTERQVVVLKFDDQAILGSVRLIGLKDGQEVDLVSRETPSFGQSPTVLQQMLGNLGKFNKDDSNPRR